MIEKLLAAQRSLAEFGSFAFRSNNLNLILDKAADMCATHLNARYCQVCQYRPEQNDLLIVAGYGWQDDVVGHKVSRADLTTPGGLAFITRESVVCRDLRDFPQFDLPAFYAQYGIISTINVIIPSLSSEQAPFGILEIDNCEPHDYQEFDITYLMSFANVLAEAVATSHRIATLQTALGEKDVLSRELQHRVRNNLHLIGGMLAVETAQIAVLGDSFRTISFHVQALAVVYDHLLGTGFARSIAFDQYLERLLDTLRDLQSSPTQKVEVIHGPMASIEVDLDTATSLGIAVTELITNSYKHAFPSGRGRIEISLDHDSEMARLIVQDNGIGNGTSPRTNRHGLGLVRRLVEQVNGSITIDHTDAGTHCEIILPIGRSVKT